jgi:hypothetical protein
MVPSLYSVYNEMRERPLAFTMIIGSLQVILYHLESTPGQEVNRCETKKDSFHISG